MQKTAKSPLLPTKPPAMGAVSPTVQPVSLANPTFAPYFNQYQQTKPTVAGAGTITNREHQLIYDKARAGTALSAPTGEKSALYDYYKANPNSQFQNNLGGTTMSQLYKKAQTGSPLDMATGAKNALYNYYQQNGLNPAVKQTDTTPYNQITDNYNQQVNQSTQNYQNSQAAQDASKWQNATISDIAKKYGFDYSRDYAKQQAEAEAQALRNANADAQRRLESNKKTGLQDIDNNLMNMAEELDRNYFQQFLQQQQNQVGSGLNGGIASDQDLRLQMNRQAEMGASYRDANQGRMKINENFSLEDLRLAEDMGLIDQKALAREDSLYNTRLQEGFQNLQDERNFYTDLDQQYWDRGQTEIDRALRMYQTGLDQQNWFTDFEYGKGRDQVADQQDMRDYNRLIGRDKVSDRQWTDEFNYTKGRDQISDAQWDKTFNYNRQVDTRDQAWREYQFKNMSASEKANLQQNAAQFGEDMAWRLFEYEGNQEFQRGQYEAEIGAYGNANFSGGTGSAPSAGNYGLGSLSRQYESNGRIDVIANNKGDIGGKSYGAYQLSTTSGNAQKFANQYGGQLRGKKVGTVAFDKAWKAEAARDPKKFEAAQHNYIKQTHFDPVVKKHSWVLKYPKAVQDAVWSTSVQHGVGGATKILNKISVGMSPEAVIKAIYAERGRNNGMAHFPSSDQATRNSVVKRFKQEERDALAMLRG